MDDKNKTFGLSIDGNELDWIKLAKGHIILFYDENQSIRPSDVDQNEFQELNPTYKFH